MARKFKSDVSLVFSYKNPKQLIKYTDMYGQIEPISKTGLSVKQQKQLATEIKRARHLALMPFVSQG